MDSAAAADSSTRAAFCCVTASIWPMARLISVIAFAFFAMLLIVRHRLRRPNMVYAPGEPWQGPTLAQVANAEPPGAEEQPTEEGMPGEEGENTPPPSDSAQ